MKYNVSLDEKVVTEARIVLKEELNMTLSKYIEIQLRALVRSKTQTQKDMFEGVVADLFDGMMKKIKSKKKTK